MLRLGLDVDGVLADFRAAFHTLAAGELGRRDVEPELSKGDIERLWKAVARASNWWLNLGAYEPAEVARLYELSREHRWEVFFMTSRPPSAGDSVQLQTQVWLEKCGFYLPSVMTAPAGARGELARALKLDLVVDDHLVNCMEIVGASNARVLHMARGEADQARRDQAETRGIGVVTAFSQALDAAVRLHDVLSSRQGRLVRLGDWFAPRKGETTLPRDPRQNRS